MDQTPQLIRFDWAIKSLLRDKANFDVLEGFLSAVLRENVHVEEILESESNSSERNDKFNRVDILVKDRNGRRLIIEIQNQREADYLERLLFGVSKVVIENQALGKHYRDISKVISISILYFNLGTGDDYVYYGTTEFRGLHTGHPLIVREKVEQLDSTWHYHEKKIFPEYYLINVERFEDEIGSAMDEWIYMLKHSCLRDDFQSAHIDQARKKLALINMGENERKHYERFLKNLAIEKDVIQTAKEEGREEGREEGLEEGQERGIDLQKRKTVLLAHKQGILPDIICNITHLTLEQVEAILAQSDQPASF